MSRVCVCVPARNEAARVPILIAALARQAFPAPILLAMCVNNSDDGTADIARRCVDGLAGRIELRLIRRDFPAALAHAGSARRAAMDLGADWLADDAELLISTDADCRPPEDWVAANAAAAAPDRVVGGRIALDEAEAGHFPAIFGLRRRFDAYWSAVRAIEDSVDPCPWDRPPRHGDHTGASLALPVGLYRRAGGVPPIGSGEDRALVQAAVAAGGRLVHPQSVWTRASCRTAGRASGGMAADMRNWLEMAEAGATPHVPAWRHWRERAIWRREHRRVAGDGDVARAESALAPMPCDMPLPMVSAP